MKLLYETTGTSKISIRRKARLLTMFAAQRRIFASNSATPFAAEEATAAPSDAICEPDSPEPATAIAESGINAQTTITTNAATDVGVIKRLIRDFIPLMRVFDLVAL